MSDTPITDAALCISHHPNDLLGWPEGRKAEFMGEHIVPARVCRQLERELAEANRIIKECLSVMPVGYIPSHTPENLPAKIEGLLKELAENTTIRHERVAEELAEVTKQRDEAKAEMRKARNALKKVTGALRYITNDFSAFKHYAQTKNNFGGSYGIYSIDRAKRALADVRKLIAAVKGGEG